MIIYHTAKFSCLRHCSSGDTMFLVLGGQDYECPASARHYCVTIKHIATILSQTKFQDVDTTNSGCVH